MKISKIIVFTFTSLVFMSFKQLPNSTEKKTITSGTISQVIINDTITSPSVYKENVHASYYSNKLNGKRTASGKRFDNTLYTAAHKKLPFGTKVKVTNLKNNKSVIVTITDRGPFSKGREIDLTKKSFMEITHHKGAGILRVKIEVL